MHPEPGAAPHAANDVLWRQWAWLYLGSCAFTLALQWGYVVGLTTEIHGVSWLAFAMAMVSQAAFLNLIPALLTAWPWLRWQHRTWARIFAGGLFALLQVALLADIAIFRLFQRHFDSLVWNVLTTKGSGDSVRVDIASCIMASAIIILVLVCGVAFALWAAPRLARRRLRFGLAVILVAALAERTYFAAIDLRDNSTMQAVRDTLPLYQPLTIKHLAKRFGYQRPTGEIRVQPDNARSLHLPRHPLGFSAEARKPNIVFVGIEGGRFDALDAVTMPNLSSLADDSFRLTKHFSTGNETRFGIFGLLYGIPGTYWHRALAQSVAPPWLDLLARSGYEFRIMSCTDLNYPEFRQTAFLKLTNDITDQWNAPHVERDRLMTEKFLDYLAERAKRPAPAQPFFAFLFFDASHQPYSSPPEDNLFGGSSEEINYLSVVLSPTGVQTLKGSYRNSLHYIDRQIGRIVKALHDRDEYRETIIVVVGDHGEEFGELGHFGHCSAFNRYQTQTFGVLHLPGEVPSVVTHVTSHADFVPSVLTWMGITNAIEDYTTGEPIQGNESRTWALLAGWRDTALFSADSITIFKPSRTLFLDMSDRELPGDDPRRATSKETLQALQQIRLFYN